MLIAKSLIRHLSQYYVFARSGPFSPILSQTYLLPHFAFLCAGASEMLMSNAVQELAGRTPGKESIAMEAFARALRQVREAERRGR